LMCSSYQCLPSLFPNGSAGCCLGDSHCSHGLSLLTRCSFALSLSPFACALCSPGVKQGADRKKSLAWDEAWLSLKRWPVQFLSTGDGPSSAHLLWESRRSSSRHCASEPS
jgi:hypothetical protein